MSNGDDGNWLDDFIDIVTDLWPRDGCAGNRTLCCIFEATTRFANDPVRRAAAGAECRERFGDIGLGGGGSGVTGGGVNIDDILGDIKDDLGGFLDDLLGGVTGNLDGLFGVLEDALRDAIGGLGARAGATVGDIGDIAGTILGQVGLSSQGALDIIGLTAGGALESVGGVLGEITSNVGATIDDFLRRIRDAIENAINAMSSAVTSALNEAIRVISNVVGNLVDSIRNVVESAVQQLTDLFNRVVGALEEFVRSSIDRITEITDRVFTAVAEVVENIRDELVQAFENITAFIGNQIEAATAALNAAQENIVELGQALLRQAEEVNDAVVQNVNAAIAALEDVSASALGAVRESLDNLSTGIITLLDGLPEALRNGVAGPITAGLTRITDFVVGSPDDAPTEVEPDWIELFECVGLPREAAQRVANTMNCLFGDIPVVSRFFRAIGALLLYIQMVAAFTSQVGQAAGIKALQDMQPAFPIALPDPTLVQEMLRQGTVVESTAIDLLQKNGLSPDNARRILDVRRRLPEIGIVQTWWLRDFVTTEQALQLFQQLGFQAPDDRRLLDMAFFIPPVQDLITMSVREVFTPAVAERFGQFEDFPQRFAAESKKQGVSEEWARNYWAAHWSLPSVQMGFEMLHRRVIDQTDLELLLRSQDVMPFWREKLTQISFAPLTRVDVRRMHKLGVLNRQEIFNAYRDIGYNDENAERLTVFTEQLNAPRETEAAQQLEGLTRTAIINLFRRGTISRSDAGELLRTIGLGTAAAETFLQVAELQSDEEERDAERDLIIDRAKAGIITRAQAEDQLNALGMSARETELALIKLGRELDREVKLPGKSDLDAMVAAGIIGEALYLDTLQRQGFSAAWATRFLQLARRAS